jgi:hypothetical protein
VDLHAELARCDSEIELRRAGLADGTFDTHPGGAILGLYDWFRERELIVAEIKKKAAPVVTFKDGVVSSPCPRYELVPLNALIALARRFERGVRIKKDGAWNAISKNQAAVEDVEFVVNRLAHGIEHSYKAIARITGSLPPLDEEDVADGGDAGAIMFAGALLAEYKARGK